jgi:uncharacterized membrane protein YciS (DUF1049 family)
MTTEIIYFLAGLAVGWLVCGLLVKWKIRRNRRKSQWRRLKD